jgi:predicted Rossmann fold nucleotide-binding protein DprA/Smf involved in DNA uptake
MESSLLIEQSPPPSGQPVAKITDARRERAKECATKLSALASEYPELARHIRQSVKAVEREIKRTPEQDNSRVIAALEKGNADITEIVRRVRLPRSTVYEALHRYPLNTLVEVRNEYVIQEPGRGGYRRARKIYGLKHSMV